MHGSKTKGNNDKTRLCFRCWSTTIVITKALLILVLYALNLPTFDKSSIVCFIITTLYI